MAGDVRDRDPGDSLRFLFCATSGLRRDRPGSLCTYLDPNVSVLEAQQMARLLSLAQALGMTDFVGTMTAGARHEPESGSGSIHREPAGPSTRSGPAGTVAECFGSCRM